jgi:hypothetical protein
MPGGGLLDRVRRHRVRHLCVGEAGPRRDDDGELLSHAAELGRHRCGARGRSDCDADSSHAGANLTYLGKREPTIYVTTTSAAELDGRLHAHAPGKYYEDLLLQCRGRGDQSDPPRHRRVAGQHDLVAERRRRDQQPPPGQWPSGAAGASRPARAACGASPRGFPPSSGRASTTVPLKDNPSGRRMRRHAHPMRPYSANRDRPTSQPTNASMSCSIGTSTWPSATATTIAAGPTWRRMKARLWPRDLSSPRQPSS